MTEKLRDLTAEDREWIDARADHLFRDSERQRGGIRPATIMPQDFRDYFVAQAAWERAALAAAPQPVPEQGMTRAEVGQMLDTKRHDREVLVEVINAAMDGRELVDGEPWGAEAIADALLAAGWTRGGDAAGLRRDDAG